MTITSKISSLSLKQIPQNLFLVLGAGISGDSSTNFNPETNSVFGKRIAEYEKIFIGKNNIWQSGKKYNQWSPDVAENYYVLNDNNNVVYLCVSNNINNLINYDTNVSSVLPTHTTPTINQSSDGYSWIPLFRVNFTQLQHISNTDLPIPKIQLTQIYGTFEEKYSSLCSSGTTSFGSCCLYFKENTKDEILNIVYEKGELTNETILSTCYECQKMSETLNREVLFLGGKTAGNITSSNGKNPLCPSTKIVKTLLETLEANKFISILGSSNEFAYNLLSTFTNNTGIMASRIDLSILTEQDKTVSIANPLINIISPIGSGATLRLKTFQKSQYSHEIMGIELLTSGSNYETNPDFIIPDSTSSSLYNAITLQVYPVDMFENLDYFVPINTLKIATSVNTDQLLETVVARNITKFSIVSEIKTTEDDSLANYTENNRDHFTFEDRHVCGLSGATRTEILSFFTPSRGAAPAVGQYAVQYQTSGYVINHTKNDYLVHSTGARKSSDNKVYYTSDSSGSMKNFYTTGIISYTTDNTNAVDVGDIVIVNNDYYEILETHKALLNKTSYKQLATRELQEPIENILGPTKQYGFHININIK